MRRTITILLIFISCIQLKADHFITLNKVVSINIPGAYPDTFSRGKLEGFGTYWDACFYEALSMNDPKVKSSTPTSSELAEYYNMFSDSWIQQFKGKIKDQYEVYLDDYSGRHIYFEAMNEAKLPQLWHTEIFLIDKTVYVFSINAAKGKRNLLEDYSNGYFNSLRMKTAANTFDEPKAYEMSEYDKAMKQKYEKEYSTSVKRRNVVGRFQYMIMITGLSVILFAIGIGVFFLIRYFYKKYDQ